MILGKQSHMGKKPPLKIIPNFAKKKKMSNMLHEGASHVIKRCGVESPVSPLTIVEMVFL